MAREDLSCLLHRPILSDYEMVPRHPVLGELAAPFSVQSPLLFHVITNLPPAGQGDAELLRMIAAGVELVPPARGDRATHLMYPRDAAAGDDEYLFLSVLNTFRLKMPGAQEPALAFDAGALWDASDDGFAFRIRDLESVYNAITKQVESYGDEVPEDWESWTQEAREHYMEEEAASICSEELRCAAELGTQSDPEKAWTLLDLYVRLAAGELTGPQAWRKAKGLVPDDEGADEFCPEAAELPDEWAGLFSDAPESLADAVWSVAMGESPEILYPASLPLCCAIFWRDHRGVWAPLPEEICAAARARRGVR